MFHVENTSAIGVAAKVMQYLRGAPKEERQACYQAAGLVKLEAMGETGVSLNLFDHPDWSFLSKGGRKPSAFHVPRLEQIRK